MSLRQRKVSTLPEVVVSQAAQADLRQILAYTVKQWGLAQASQYSAALRRCFLVLAANP
jgi:plasmid stabilization system protein ParE